MDFFTAQDNARKSTTGLVCYFFLAVISLIILTNLLIMGVMAWAGAGINETPSLNHFAAEFDWYTFALVSVGVTIVILTGSLYKMIQLNSGGKVVAEALGGQLVSQNTQDPMCRKLLNVVEEMAIAAGTPVPPVYILADEAGINAFAAGMTPSDAVIGVTKGCIQQLNRDQLQGVMAHEFSHILNGDMRLNIRLMGVLHGILIIGLIGYFILRSMTYSRRGSSRSKGNGGMALIALGGGLMVIGYAGTFFGNLIKASVSRQREYLADASAVQFTRNPDSIAGALKRIGGFKAQSYIESSSAKETSHLFFCSAIHSFFGSMLSTHPPLEKRIKRIEPRWNGKFDKTVITDVQNATPEELPNQKAATVAATAAVVTAAAEAMQALGSAGQVDKAHIEYARKILTGIPPAIQEAVREPYGARAVIYVLLISSDQVVMEQQLAILEQNGDIGIHALTIKLLPEMATLDTNARLPMIDLAMPSLRQLSLRQYQLFKQNLIALIAADKRVNLFEWSLQHILLRHLDTDFIKRPTAQAKHRSLGELKPDTTLLISLLAYADRAEQKDAEHAFTAAKKILEHNDITLLPKDKLSLTELNTAIKRLAMLKPLVKPQLLKACTAAVMADDRVTPQESELVRAFAAALDCPLPPMLANAGTTSNVSSLHFSY
ncbi:Heat shock protein HtpX / FIG017973: domain of unknown function [hydrothermal vent metagenome]|uniref:Peptidase M48 domain-containing protein n=1 Tax=hydrothermal vent metagenome TaxID=652676 RepID=A0A3B1BS48_9ZZZZ